MHRLGGFCSPRHQDLPLIMQRKPDMGLPMDLGNDASIRIAFGLVTAGIRIEAERFDLQSKLIKLVLQSLVLNVYMSWYLGW